MEKQKNIPTLRFPEFTGDWEKKKLGEVTSFLDGKRKPIKSSDRSKIKGIYPYYGASGIIDYVNDYIFDEEIILLGEDGENIISRNLPLAFKVIGKCWINNHAHVLKPNVNYQIDFLTQLLENVSYVQYNTGTAQPKLNQEICRGIQLSFPTLPEQTKIAEFFTAIDKKIQALKKKKSLLGQYKKGVMQQLFCLNYDSENSLNHDSLDLHDEHDFDGENQEKNQEKKSRQSNKSSESRFRQEDGSKFPKWEMKKLGEVGETYGGLSGKTKENFGIGKPYIQYKQIFDDSKIDISRFELVDVGENESQNKVQFGDVFFTVSSETPNEIGMSSVLLDKIEELYLNSFCFGYRANSLYELSPYFSQYLFRSELFRTEIIKLAQGSTRYNMSKIQLLKIEINLPCLDEQTAIANFLSSIDNKITNVQLQITNMETWKKGLLQKMFV